MLQYLMRVEGVNFASTLDDTNDLSTIRGASLALLRAETIVFAVLSHSIACISNVKRVFAGASQCAFLFDVNLCDANDKPVADAAAQAVREVLASGKGVDADLAGAVAHLSFVVDVVSVSSPDTPDALERATARNRSRQFRQWTLPIPAFEKEATEADPFSSVLPGITPEDLARLPPGKFGVRDTAQRQREERRFAPSVLARRHYGRKQRQAFYQEETGAALGKDLAYADHFQDMVAQQPGVALSLRSKIAVLYADGNSFGKIRDEMAGELGGAIPALEKFATDLGALRKCLLADLCQWYRDGIAASTDGLDRFAVKDDKDHQKYDLRLETLLWGGDELIFVMPGWLALAALDSFFKHTKDWNITGTATGRNPFTHKLTHAVGLVICHHKTPIRQAKAIAKELAETGKTACQKQEASNTASIAIFESLSPSETDIGAARAGAYGAEDETQLNTLNGHLTLPGDEFGSVLEIMRQIKGLTKKPSLPRSVLYRMLREVRAKGGFLADSVEKKLEDMLEDHAKRTPKETAVARADLAFPKLTWQTQRPLAITLGMMAELWDYAEPFAERTSTGTATKGGTP